MRRDSPLAPFFSPHFLILGEIWLPGEGVTTPIVLYPCLLLPRAAELNEWLPLWCGWSHITCCKSFFGCTQGLMTFLNPCYRLLASNLLARPPASQGSIITKSQCVGGVHVTGRHVHLLRASPVVAKPLSPHHCHPLYRLKGQNGPVMA